jgi:hypothetical protein
LPRGDGRVHTPPERSFGRSEGIAQAGELPDRILTSHAGSLPRPESLISLNELRAAGEFTDEEAYRRELSTAVAAAVTARKPVPAKLPASDISPDAKTALLRAGRRGLQMVLRLLAHNAEHWLSGHLNTYLRDDDEYRAITRQTIIRGLAGTITYAPAAITVTLEQPASRRVARALELLLDEINADPPAMPGDTRPITYQITPHRI